MFAVPLVSFACLVFADVRAGRLGYRSAWLALMTSCSVAFVYMAIVLIVEGWPWFDWWMIVSAGAFGFGAGIEAWRNWRKWRQESN